MSEEAPNNCKAKRIYLVLDSPADDCPFMYNDPELAGKKAKARAEDGINAIIVEAAFIRKVKVSIKTEVVLEEVKDGN